MTKDEKIAFLKRMGYSGSCVCSEDGKEKAEKEKLEVKKKKSNLVDKDELLNLNRIFNPEKVD